MTITRPLGTSDNRFIAVGGVAIPLVILMVVGVVTIHATRAIWADTPSSVHIEVVAVQWYWEVHEPDGIVTANEIPVPVGEQVEIGLRSRDVIHSFWVPQLAGQGGRHPRPAQHDPLHRLDAGHLSGPVRRVLRHPARPHDLLHRRHDPGRLPGVAGPPSSPTTDGPTRPAIRRPPPGWPTSSTSRAPVATPSPAPPPTAPSART